MLYSSPLQRVFFLLAGPFGCYAVYNAVFIWRLYDSNKYPSLAHYYEWPGMIELVAVYAVSLALSIWASCRYIPALVSRPKYPRLSRVSLALMVAATTVLMAMTILRVFGTLSPSAVTGEYARYFRLSRVGGAWIILAAYAVLYGYLLDMYFGGVNRWNSTALLVSVVLNFVTGGRTILMCVLLAYIFLLYAQRPKYLHLIAGLGAATAIAVMSFVSVTELRLPTEEQLSQAGGEEAAEQHYKMNYNSAFVINDVLKGLSEGRLTPYPHFLIDTMYLMPRAILPNKPVSTSDTRAVYPEIASRGTTMSFPLSANIAMHLGAWAFVLGAFVAALCQWAFVWGASKRLGVVSFLAFFWGAMFMLAARGGIFNYRIVLHSVMIAVMFFAYSQVAKGFLAGWFMVRQRAE